MISIGNNTKIKNSIIGSKNDKEIKRLQQELQRKDNIISELKQNKRDYERENILEMKLHILDNNWNELKEWLEVKEEKETIGTFSDVLDKIKEIESK